MFSMAISLALTLFTGVGSVAVACDLQSAAENNNNTVPSQEISIASGSIVDEPEMREFEGLTEIEKEMEQIERITDSRLENRHGRHRVLRGGSRSLGGGRFFNDSGGVRILR